MGVKLTLPSLINCIVRANWWKMIKRYAITTYFKILILWRRWNSSNRSGYFSAKKSHFMGHVVIVVATNIWCLFVAASMLYIVRNPVKLKTKVTISLDARMTANQKKKKWSSLITWTLEEDLLDSEILETPVLWTQDFNVYLI